MTHPRREDLPALAREAVAGQVGKVFSVVPAPRGADSQITTTLRTAAGPVFLKGVGCTNRATGYGATGLKGRWFPQRRDIPEE